MDFLKDFISVLKLDNTFFIQFVLVAVFYFITTRLFLTPYVNRQEQRRSLTKGRLDRSERLKEETEVLKERYAQTARKAHQKFQEIFQKTHRETLEKHKKQVEAVEKEGRELLKKERSALLQKKKAAEEEFRKDSPLLVKTLTAKLRGDL